MQQYMILAVIIRFMVDFLLFFAVKKLFSPCSGALFPLLGAVAGAVYAGCSMIGRLSFLQESHWYMVSSILCCLLVFGLGRRAVVPSCVFCLLRLALDGLSGKGGILTQLPLGILLCVLLILGFGEKQFCRRFVPVELTYGGKTVRLRALWDTGHDLRDPVTGQGVLVIGCDAAGELTGLQPAQLSTPVDAMGTLPGLRLIPYQTVGASGQMMLAMQISETKIGTKRKPCLVAFAPQVLDSSGKFQALIGGTV